MNRLKICRPTRFHMLYPAAQVVASEVAICPKLNDESARLLQSVHYAENSGFYELSRQMKVLLR